MRWLRVFAVPAQDEDFENITFDIFVDATSLARKAIYFGMWGTVKSEIVEPFIIQPDGKVDFGENIEDRNIRIGSINIFSKPIMLGEYFTLIRNDSEFIFVIKKITDFIVEFS